ncbi:MAG: hypothetical protein ABIP49_02510 [Lysobacterales bacterium]
MTLFFALIGVAIAISGMLGFLFFWAMTQVHLHDRHVAASTAARGFGFASPRAIAWLLFGRYRGLGDGRLDGLALPAQVCLWATLAGLLAAGALAVVENFA